VLEIAFALPWPAWFLRGNAERAVIDFAAGTRKYDYPNDEWMVAAHGPDGVAALGEFAHTLRLTTDGIGDIRLCHGSPRSDIEALTPATPDQRLELATVGVGESIVGHGHTHYQYQRQVRERTFFGPGSVGIPYGTEGRPGARWALVTDRIDLRVTPYDVEESIEIARAVDYPGLPNYEKYLRTPLTRDELIEDAEAREFAD
jgi:diadenosine tetraphosphatase ApaH/serine/threonine PP2A family protein phosphatase